MNSRLFMVKGVGKERSQNIAVIILPQESTFEVVCAAWSHAIRYTAKGFDIPDYDKAGELLLQRHPTWQFVKGAPVPVDYSAEFADKDL